MLRSPTRTLLWAAPALPLAGALLWHVPAAVSAPPAAKRTKRAAAAARPSGAAAAASDAFPRDVLPTVRTYCVPCHSGANAPAGVALDKDATTAEALKRRALWERVIANVQGKAMPPAGSPAPSLAQREKLVAALQTSFARATCDVHDPGRVTARRLNRAEYVNSIRDLTGVEIPGLTDDFPSDEVGYGFDNIGDVLSLSPLLLEKYLAAAGRIARAALPAPEDGAARLRPLTTLGFRLNGDGDGFGASGRMLFTTGAAGMTYDFPAPGRYILRAVAWQQAAGPDSAKMGFLVDGNQVAAVDVPALEAHPGTYEAAVEVPAAGKKTVAISFLNDYYNADSPDPRLKGDRNLVVESLTIVPSDSVTLPAAPLTEAARRLLPYRPDADTEAAKDSATRRNLRPFLLRAYRRPPTDAEVERLERLAARVRGAGASFERGMQAAVQAALVSPSFLFRIERDPADPRKERPLGDYELATRLSYFLWSSTPDDHLLALAGTGRLHNPTVLEAEARRMLQDPRAAQALGDNFAAQWLQLRKLDRVTPSHKVFPQWNNNLREAMRSETLLYFRHVVTDDRDIREFLDSDYTFLNGPLAKLYGDTDVAGSAFHLVHLTGGQRGGMLTQASVLTVTSNPTRTSPVKRGKWVMENLLGETIPPPPPGVPQLPDDGGRKKMLTGTLRQRMEQHRSNPACASCHQKMDPIGFGLENYDGIGMWRRFDDGHDIDATGTLPNGKSFNGPVELRAILKSMTPQFIHAFSEKMLTYALGRGVEDYDRCSVDAIAARAAKQNYRFSSLVTGIVLSEPFRYRRGDISSSAAVTDSHGPGQGQGHRRAPGES